MQDAFYQEKSDVGTWPEIGYSAPGTASTNKSTYSSNVITFSGAETHNWIATPINALNDCTHSMSWQLNASVRNNDVQIADGTASASRPCLDLTASWSNLLKNNPTN